MQKLIITDYPEARDFLFSNEWEMFAFDTETWDKETHKPSVDITRLEVFGLSLCNGEAAAYIQLANWEHKHRDMFFRNLRQTLLKGKACVAHNITFDCKTLLTCTTNKDGKDWPVDIRGLAWFDTMIADHLIDENNPHGLKDVVVRELGVPQEEANKLNRVWEVFGPLSKQFQEYGLKDAMWAWELYEKQKPLLESEGVADLFYKLEMPFLRSIVEMEMTGIKVDKQRMLEMKRRVEDEMLDLEILMLESIDRPYELQGSLFSQKLIPKHTLNFSSNQQMCEIIYEQLGFPIEEETDTGNPSLGKAAMNKLQGKHPFIDYLQQYKTYSKLLGGFLNPLPDLIDSDGRVRASFWDHGTKTGRLSSSKPNLQQLPNPVCLKCGSDDVMDGNCSACGYDKVPDVRSCFIVDDDKAMIAADFSQQETVIMANICDDTTLKEGLSKNMDFHLINAKAMFDLDVPDEYFIKGHPKYKEVKKKYQGERRLGKTLTFKVPYGAEKWAIANDLDCDLETAQSYLDAYYKKYDGVAQTMKETHEQAEKEGYVTNLLGRKRRFHKYWQTMPWGDKVFDYQNGYKRQAFNFIVQSLGTELIRKSCIIIQKYSQQFPQYDIKLLATIHDEIVLECKKEYAPKVSKDIVKIMSRASNFKVPLGADASYGKNYSVVK